MLTIATEQQSNTIPALEARRRLGELLELSYYQGKQFRIARKDKPMAWIVGGPSMEIYNQAIDYIIEHKPELADTLAISLDNELRGFIERGIKEAETGELHPIESILDE